LPFGELLVNQKVGPYETPYKFTGKESDPETDLTYFGARYYDAALAIWLGVDPLAEKYPAMSPFTYVFNNPIRLVDPNGMEVDEPPINGLDLFKDDTGLYLWNESYQNYDRFYTEEDNDQVLTGTYTANKFKEPVGDFTIIFDLSGKREPDKFDYSRTPKFLANNLLEYLSSDDNKTKVLTDQKKYPGVQIYSNPKMNGAVTLGNVIFTNPGMEDRNTLDHEYGHYLDFKFHFHYNIDKYFKEIGLPSIWSATKATLGSHDHMNSESEMRANILGGEWSWNSTLYRKSR